MVARGWILIKNRYITPIRGLATGGLRSIEPNKAASIGASPQVAAGSIIGRHEPPLDNEPADAPLRGLRSPLLKRIRCLRARKDVRFLPPASFLTLLSLSLSLFTDEIRRLLPGTVKELYATLSVKSRSRLFPLFEGCASLESLRVEMAERIFIEISITVCCKGIIKKLHRTILKNFYLKNSFHYIARVQRIILWNFSKSLT